jgi:uncharacterized protein with GYD domain
MPKFLIEGSYSPEGIRGVIKEGFSSRKAAVEKLLAGLNGKLEAMYFALGSNDYFIIGEVPDLVSAAAVKLVVNATGMATTAKSTLLVSTEEVDAACKVTVAFRPPGA